MISDQHKPTIVILLPMVWSIRNVIHSGVLARLTEADLNVYLLMRKCPQPEDTKRFKELSYSTVCENLISPKRKRKIRGRSLLRVALHNAHSSRNRISSYSIYQRWFTRNYRGTQRFFLLISDLLGIILRLPFMFRLSTKFYRWLLWREYDLNQIKDQLRRLGPDLIWSTANVESEFEHAYVMAAEELEIPVITSILSFDNLTTQSVHLNYLEYAHYLVWNLRMRDQLLQLYPHVSSVQVTITGTPQFDFHRQQEYSWSRETTLAHLGLPPDARYFLYTASVTLLAPDEPLLVAELARRLEAHAELQNYWLVVRPHPRDGMDRWTNVQNASYRVVLSKPWSTASNDDLDYWSLSTHEDQARLINSLAHAEACLNIASTTSLDAAILDRPVIGIRFDQEPKAPSEILYEEYDTAHYSPLVDSGGIWVARNWQELMVLLIKSLQAPQAGQLERANMVFTECGVLDGHAADRVADALLKQLEYFRAQGEVL